MPRLMPKIGPLALTLMLAESASLIREHWGRLAVAEQREFRRLVAKARGRPSNLDGRERAQLSRLIARLELGVLGREMIRTVSPVGMGRRR